MKKTILLVAISLLISTTLLAQSRSRVFDNFDTSNGVNVVTPTVKPLVSSRSTAKRQKVNSQNTQSVSSGLGLKKTSSSKFIMGTSEGMKGYTTGDPVVDMYITDSSRRYGIDPLLIYAQMHQESAFKKRARSHKGASGLMQLMPATARRFGVTDIYNPRQNIDAGVKYMRWLLRKFDGDVVLALAGYNAGEGAVMKYGNNVPPYRETREYVRRITKRYKAISDGGQVQTITKAQENQVAKKITKEKPKPLTVYELDVLTVKLPDGRMRLVSN